MIDRRNAHVILRRGNEQDARDIAEIWHLGWRDGHRGFVPQELLIARTGQSFRARASERAGEAMERLVTQSQLSLDHPSGREHAPARPFTPRGEDRDKPT